MTNKKIWLSILAVILVVCMSVGMLVSCSKTEDDGGDDVVKKTTAIKQLFTGLQKTLDSVTEDFTDLAAGAKIEIDLQNGTETKKYTVQANIIFDVLEKGETSVTEAKTKLEVEVLEESTVVLGVYYYDQVQSNDALVYEGNMVYLYENFDKDSSPNKYKFKAPYVKDSQRVKNAPIDFSKVEDEGVSVAAVNNFADIIEGFLDNVKQSDSAVSFSLNFDKVLNSEFVKENLGDDLASTVNGYMTTLGLNYNWTQIKALLGRISISASATFDTDKALSGLQLSLGLKKGDIEINKTDKTLSAADAKLLKVGISKDVSATVKLDYKIGKTLFTSKLASDGYNYNTYNYRKDILNVGLSVDLDLGEPIKMDFGTSGIGVNIPAGQYTLQLAVMADPFAIVEKINNGLSFKGVGNIMNAITEILPLFDQIDIELYERGTGDTRGASHLSASIVKQYANEEAYNLAMSKATVKATDDDGKQYDELTGKDTTTLAYISTDIISKDNSSSGLNFDGVGITELIGNLSGLIAGADEAQVDETAQLLQTIGGYLLGAYIGINDGTENVYAQATFDTNKTTQKKIPFSNYTEFKGAYNASYKYYTKKAEFKQGVTYYVKQQTATTFTGTAFDSDKTYYTKENNEYKLSLDTEPESGKTYYYDIKDSYVENEADYNANTTYYYIYDNYVEINTSDKDKEGYVAKPVAGTNYYKYNDKTKKWEEYTKSSFKSGDKYAIKEDAWAEMGNEAKYFTFEEATGLNATNFSSGTYYVGPEFGITLTASLVLDADKTNHIIEATVGGLDVIGLPASLTVAIGNLKITMYEAQPDYVNNDNGQYVHVNSYNEVF